MWNEHHFPQLLQSNGQPRLSKSAPCSPMKPLLAKRPAPARADSFHVIHKVPVGDTPYVKAKHVQLVDKDPNRAIALFWAAINAGDRVDSALKDMAIVMKQQNRPEEAIEAIKSLRFRCSEHAQESLDNVLLDLYKRCGRLDDQVALLKHKLHLIHQGLAFNGRRTKTARSQGKKFQVSIEQEATRLLGNLGWAYMQQCNYVAAEAVYRKALSIEPDNNKVCNLGICLMKQGRLKEAKAMLKSVKPARGDSPWGSDSHLKSFERAQQMLQEMEGAEDVQQLGSAPEIHHDLAADEEPLLCSSSSWRWNSQNPLTDSDLSGALFATAGFGPAQRPPLPPPQQQQHQPQQLGEANIPQQQHLGAANIHSSRWEEEDAEQGFADENSSQELVLAKDQPVNWHAEVLRQRLEKVEVMGANSMKAGVESGSRKPQQLERSNSTGSAASSIPAFPPPIPSLAENNGRVLNSAALPFVAKSFSASCTNVSFAGEDKKRSSTPLSFDSANHQQAPPAPPKSASFSGRPSQLLLLDRASPDTKKNCCKSLSFSFPAEGENSGNISSPDAWSRLGFIQGDSSSPLCTIATALRKRLNNSKPSLLPLLQDDCQRRLQVFVEMTLPASPQA